MAEDDMARYELTEARSEIRRHHRDFAAIREELDRFERGCPEAYAIFDVAVLTRRLRNIVG